MEIKIKDDIYLVPLKKEDAPEIFQMIDSEREHFGEWLPFVSMTNSVEYTQGFVDEAIELAEKNSEQSFTIRKEGKLIGIIGNRATDKENNKTEVGYWLSAQAQGQGIMSLAVKAICRFIFDSLKMNRIVIRCAVGNEKSKAIPRKLGFTYEGIERDGELISGDLYRNIEVYSLLRSERGTRL